MQEQEQTMTETTATNGSQPAGNDDVRSEYLPHVTSSSQLPAQSPQNRGPQNVLELVGSLVRQDDTKERRFRRERLVVTEKQAGGHSVTRLMLAVQEEHGVGYTIPLTIQGDLNTVLDGIEQGALEHGVRVRVQGRLSFQTVYDDRFASEEYPMGRRYTAVVAAVQTITPLSVLEARGEPLPPPGSYIVVEGEIVRVVRIIRHEIERAVEMARTTLSVEMRGVNSRGLEIVTEDEVGLAMPLALTGIEAGLRRGNTVRVRGFLEPVLVRINPANPREQEAQAFLDEQQEIWEQRTEAAVQRETNRDGNPLSQQAREGIQSDARRSVAHDKRDLLTQTVLRVRAGGLELLGGEMTSVETAREAYRAWQINNPRQRVRTTQPSRARGNGRGNNDAGADEEVVGEHDLEQEEEEEEEEEEEGEGGKTNNEEPSIEPPQPARPRKRSTKTTKKKGSEGGADE
jgi:hypothetical protein